MTAPAGPFALPPEIVRSPADGTALAVFESLAPADAEAEAMEPPRGRRRPPDQRPPLLLVHGATADHTTWRAVGPRFAATRRVYAMDRRGRGASGDAPDYSIELEFADVATVAHSIAARANGAVDVVGHSYGGRCGLGASLLTPSIRRLVVYEGAPVPPGLSYRPPGLLEAVGAALDRGDNDAALATFLGGIVGMSEASLAAYRADPVWPERVAAASTILREIEAEATGSASIEALAGVSVPVLLLLGSISRSPFRIGTDALAAQLAEAQVRVIEGAAHAAHHTHADAFVRLVEAFLDAEAGHEIVGSRMQQALEREREAETEPMAVPDAGHTGTTDPSAASTAPPSPAMASAPGMRAGPDWPIPEPEAADADHGMSIWRDLPPVDEQGG